MVMTWFPVSSDDVPVLLKMNDDDFVAWLEDEDRPQFDADKAWHGIHAVLTGSGSASGSPLDLVTWGGTEFAGDLGYGPPRLLSAADVVRAATALTAVTPDVFRSRINLPHLGTLDIYLADVFGRLDEADGNVEYLCQGFENVRGVFLQAARSGESLVICCL